MTLFSRVMKKMSLVNTFVVVRLRVGDHLVFRFKLGTLKASVRIFTATGVCHTYPQPAAQ
jgi:hypothetical protein